MSIVRSNGLRFLCYGPLINMITVQTKPIAYHDLEQEYVPRLEPVTSRNYAIWHWLSKIVQVFASVKSQIIYDHSLIIFCCTLQIHLY